MQLTLFGIPLVASPLPFALRVSLLDGSAKEATVRRKLVAYRLVIAWLLAHRRAGPPFALHAIGGVQKIPWPNVGEDPSVTPVAGPSWLTHLGLGLRDTNLGQGAERYGPAPDQNRPARDESLSVPGTLRITGADLYRLSCQACHRAEGTGAPPEIHSLLAAVQGSSLALVRVATATATR